MKNPCTKCIVRPACVKSCDEFIDFIKQPSELRNHIFSIYDPTEGEFRNIANQLIRWMINREELS